MRQLISLGTGEYCLARSAIRTGRLRGGKIRRRDRWFAPGRPALAGRPGGRAISMPETLRLQDCRGARRRLANDRCEPSAGGGLSGNPADKFRCSSAVRPFFPLIGRQIYAVRQRTEISPQTKLNQLLARSSSASKGPKSAFFAVLSPSNRGTRRCLYRPLISRGNAVRARRLLWLPAESACRRARPLRLFRQPREFAGLVRGNGRTRWRG